MEEKKQASKTYRVRVPIYMATLLDDKLKKDGFTYSKIAREGIEKYLKKR
jgi:predicted DNA-binding protein